MGRSFPSIVEERRTQRDHVAETPPPDLIVSLAQPGLGFWRERKCSGGEGAGESPWGQVTDLIALLRASSAHLPTPSSIKINKPWQLLGH